jgi:hypothetical protein
MRNLLPEHRKIVLLLGVSLWIPAPSASGAPPIDPSIREHAIEKEWGLFLLETPRYLCYHLKLINLVSNSGQDPRPEFMLEEGPEKIKSFRCMEEPYFADGLSGRTLRYIYYPTNRLELKPGRDGVPISVNPGEELQLYKITRYHPDSFIRYFKRRNLEVLVNPKKITSLDAVLDKVTYEGDKIVIGAFAIVLP